MQPFRIEPALPVTAVKTYGIVRKPGVHFRSATCAEVECAGWRDGWTTVVPSDSAQAVYIRAKSERAFTETRAGDGLSSFAFAAGQRCFRSGDHRAPIAREPVFVVREGDWRGNPRGTPAITRAPADWVDDFGEHQQTLADRMSRG